MHFEEIQLYIGGFSKDRISDFSCSFIKLSLIDFTVDQCEQIGIPLGDIELPKIYDTSSHSFKEKEKAKLPLDPENQSPVIFVPKRWSRFSPWINFDDYYNIILPLR